MTTVNTEDIVRCRLSRPQLRTKNGTPSNMTSMSKGTFVSLERSKDTLAILLLTTPPGIRNRPSFVEQTTVLTARLVVWWTRSTTPTRCLKTIKRNSPLEKKYCSGKSWRVHTVEGTGPEFTNSL